MNKLNVVSLLILVAVFVFNGCVPSRNLFPKLEFNDQVPSQNINKGNWKVWKLFHGRPTYRKTGEILIQFQDGKEIDCEDQSEGFEEFRLTTVTENICLLTFSEDAVGDSESVEDSRKQERERTERNLNRESSDNVRTDNSVQLVLRSLRNDLLRISTDSNANKFREALESIKLHAENKIVQYADPNFIVYIQKQDVPSPGAREVQWFLKDFKKLIPSESITQNQLSVVGILDTGINRAHKGLNRKNISIKDNIFTEPNDSNGHGTLVAGLIAGEDGVGVNTRALLWSLKVLDKDGYGEVRKIIQALDWIAKHNKRVGVPSTIKPEERKVNIVNMSFGFYENNFNVKILHEKILELHQRGVVMVASAGNDFVQDTMYPAKFKEVLAVGSHDERGWISRFSNWGKAVDIYAPGNDLKSTNLLQSYSKFNGTSAATAVVSGLISLIYKNPLIDPENKCTDFREKIHHLLGRASIPCTPKTIVLNRYQDFNPTPGGKFPKLNVASLRENADRSIEITQFSINERLVHPTHNPDVTIGFYNSGADHVNRDFSIRLQSKLDSADFKGNISIASQGTWGRTYKLSELTGKGLGSFISGTGQLDLILTLKVSESSEIQESTTIFVNKKWIRSANIRSLWVEPLDFFDERAKRTLRSIIKNNGNADLKGLTVEAYSIPAVHEGVWQAPKEQIGDSQLIELKRGESRTVSFRFPSSYVPPVDHVTFLVTVKNGGTVLDHYLTSFHYPEERRGVASAQFSKNVHRRLTELAVNLLEKDQIFIPDLHCKSSAYLGSRDSYNHWRSISFSQELSLPLVGVPQKTPRLIIDVQQEKGGKSLNLLAGSADPDSVDIINDYRLEDVFDSHFWLVDEGDDAGLGSRFFNWTAWSSWKSLFSLDFWKGFLSSEDHKSALYNINALLIGGGSLEKGAVDIYNDVKTNGEHDHKKVAWWLVGQALHLLGDLSVPSHVKDENLHGVFGSQYHKYMDDMGTGENDLTLNSLSNKLGLEPGMRPYINPYCGNNSQLGNTAFKCNSDHDPVRYLAYTTAQIGDVFPYYYETPPISASKKDGDGEWEGGFPHYEKYLESELRRIKDKETHSKTQCLRKTQCLLTAEDLHKAEYLQEVGAEYIRKYSYPYALRAMAGLLFYFAAETDQLYKFKDKDRRKVWPWNHSEKSWFSTKASKTKLRQKLCDQVFTELETQNDQKQVFKEVYDAEF